MRCDFFAANNRMRFTRASKKINETHVIQYRTVQIACGKTHAILRARSMRFYACVIFDAIIRSEKTQQILSDLPLAGLRDKKFEASVNLMFIKLAIRKYMINNYK